MKLGKWSPFIDIGHATTWYELPPALKAALETYVPDDNELEAIPEERFVKIACKARHLAHRSVSSSPVSYHDISHFEEVIMNGMEILEAYNHLCPFETDSIPLPRIIAQAFSIACLLHDAYHPGSTFRSRTKEGPNSVYLPELGINVTNEWVSALAADRFAEENGLNPLARLFIVVMIWATTFGATAPRGKELGLERIKPSTFFELAIVVADIAPNDNFIRFMHKSIAVSFDEIPAAPPPDTWSGWLENRIKFIQYYVFPMMLALNESAKFDLTDQLGWRDTAVSYEHHLQRMLNGAAPELTMICRAMFTWNHSINLLA